MRLSLMHGAMAVPHTHYPHPTRTLGKYAKAFFSRWVLLQVSKCFLKSGKEGSSAFTSDADGSDMLAGVAMPRSPSS